MGSAQGLIGRFPPHPAQGYLRRPSPQQERGTAAGARGVNSIMHYDGRFETLRLLYGSGQKDEFVFNHPPKNKSWMPTLPPQHCPIRKEIRRKIKRRFQRG